MKQKWKKLGKIFVPNNNQSFMASYAAVPVIDWLNADECKIYFSCRDKENRSLTVWVTIDMKNPLTIKSISKKPILTLGKAGFFDENGIMGCHILNVNNKKYLYYIGWNKAVNVPFRNAIGLAISDDGINYRKFSSGPILDRSVYDPCFIASCCVLRDNSKFKMWYLSCVDWKSILNSITHYYHIKYAESIDGINWKREGIVAIDFRYKNEYAISVPRVIKENGMFKMWYSFRGGPKGSTYRIGYAESSDGKKWKRRDEEVGLDVSESGWDSDMICYPYVFDHKGDRYMLYNGNDYGKTGFGLAVLEGK